MTEIHLPAPLYLLFLLLLPLVRLLAVRLRTLDAWRRRTIIVLRTLIVLLLVLALTRIEFRNRSRELTVYYVLDHSDSIPAEVRQNALKVMNDLSAKMPATDSAGLVVFGDQPSLETTAVHKFEMKTSPQSVVPTQRTDIASAVRLALAAFPNDSMKRVVLMSDGNENEGSALEVARFARNNNIPIDVIPLTYESHNDAQVDKLVVPQQTAKDSPFDIKVYLSAQKTTKGRLRVLEDGKPIVEEEVQIEPGRNPPWVLPRRLMDGGFHNYRAMLEVPGDTRPQNNQATGFTYLKAEPRVLYVDGNGDDPDMLSAALRVESIHVDRVTARDIPLGIDGFQNYDSMILCNVPAGDMTNGQMSMIERAVHDLGMGLIMIGGENSFGAGGYQDTPIELALPVSMDVKQKKTLPSGALAIILHTCEIPAGNEWAREISIAALNVLSAQDYFGLIYYGFPPSKTGIGGGIGGGFGEFWLWDPGLKQAGNKKEMRAHIRGVAPSDMPTFKPTMEMAYNELQRVNTSVKHIVAISDGDPQSPGDAFLKKVRDSGITISTVAISPHDPRTVDTLREMAYLGGGNFYYPKTSEELPRIFTKEATIVRKSLISEKQFPPVFGQPSETLAGLGGLPMLNGHVVTSQKELATNALMSDEDDPLLAHWRYGLGKTVAFTSDARNKWATNWVGWNQYSKFWSQVVRFSLREASSQNFQVNTDVRGGRGHISVDALTPEGDFRNFVEFETTVVHPDMKSEKVTVRQTAPGRYEGDFSASEVGTYMVSMVTGKDDNKELVTGGVALSYSPEYEVSRSNEDFLEKVATTSGGKVAGPDYTPFAHDLPTSERPKPIWPDLALLAILLLPLDVFVRRVYVDPSDVAAWVRKTVTGIRGNAAEPEAQSIASLKEVKARTRREREDEKVEAEARAAFRQRLAGKDSPAPPEGSPSVFADPNAKPTAPVRHRDKDTIVSSEGTPQRPAEGMSGLLEAKKRARKKME